MDVRVANLKEKMEELKGLIIELKDEKESIYKVLNSSEYIKSQQHARRNEGVIGNKLGCLYTMKCQFRQMGMDIPSEIHIKIAKLKQELKQVENDNKLNKKLDYDMLMFHSDWGNLTKSFQNLL